MSWIKIRFYHLLLTQFIFFWIAFHCWIIKDTHNLIGSGLLVLFCEPVIRILFDKITYQNYKKRVQNANPNSR